MGAFAVVYEAIDERDGSRVAIKAVPRKLFQSQPWLEEFIAREIHVLRAISQKGN